MMHAYEWQGQDVTGWHITEKLDGCRARWTGLHLLSRGGHPVTVHESITHGLPLQQLDIEVYAGRTIPASAGRAMAARAVQHGRWHEDVRLIVFDAPSLPGDIAQRLAAVRDRWGLPTVPELGHVASMPALLDLLLAVQAGGGEGLMLHRPGAAYRPGRCAELLKFKDADAVRLAA